MMDLHYSAGELSALEKLGLDLKAEVVKRFIRENPGAAVGGAIGTGLGLGTLVSKNEPSPKMERPYIEKNPLIYAPQH